MPPDLVHPAPTPMAQLYRAMWQHARGARLQLSAALGLMGLSQLLKLALPWLAAQAINAIQVQGRAGLATAAAWMGGILALHVGVWLLHGPARVLERGAALRVRRSLADLLYSRLAHAPLAWHERQHSGDLQHRLQQSSEALYGFTQTQFVYLQNLIHLLGPLLALWWLSAVTGAVALAGFVAIVAVVLRFDRRLMQLALVENEAERRYTARLLDCVGNIGAVASLRLQQATRALLDARLLQVFQPLSRSIVLTEWKWCAVDLLTVGLGWLLVVVYAVRMLAGGDAAGAWAGAGAAAGGTVLIGSLFMVQQYAQQAGGVLCAMAANVQGLAHTRADHASGALLLHAPQVAVPAPALAGPALALGAHAPGGQGTPSAAANWQRMALQGLSYGHAPLPDGSARGGVQGVRLELRRGERLALVGASGCGKSTLLRLLAGLYTAQAGQVCIDGQPADAQALAALSTLIPQEAEVFEASVRENLDFGAPVLAADLQRAVQAAALDEVLAGMPKGLDTVLSERGANLSGGQRQRLALARGVLAARHSSLLLLDEPTSALDALIEQDVQQRLDRAFAGACMVASVHRLGLLQHFDRVAWMDAGQVLDVGTVAELQARQPAFAALLGAHQRQANHPAAAPASSGALAGAGAGLPLR